MNCCTNLGGPPPIRSRERHSTVQRRHTLGSMPALPRNLVGSSLRRLRTEHGLSQAALAAECQRKGWDASRDMIKHIESQVREVSDLELVALASCLGVGVEALLPPAREAALLAFSYLRE